MKTASLSLSVTPLLAVGLLVNAGTACAPMDSETADVASVSNQADQDLHWWWSPRSYVRAIHLSPNAPAVDVYANGSRRIAGDLAFTDSGRFRSVRSGETDFQVTPAGADPDDAVLEVEGVELDAWRLYTTAVFGELDALTAVAFKERWRWLGRGNIQVRAIHAASGVGQVDIWNIPAEGDPALLFEDVDYGAVGDALVLPAAAYTIGFDVDNDASPDLTFDLPALSAGTRVNLYAVADDADGVYLVAQFFDGSTARIGPRVEQDPARIRVIHLSPDTPAVDVYVNGAIKAVDGLTFKSGTPYIDIEAGTYDFGVVASGADAEDTELEVNGLSLAAGGSYTAVAFDKFEDIQALALADDYEGLAEGDIRVRAIHAASDVGQVDIWAIPESGAPLQLYPDVDFGAVGSYLDLPADAYTLGFDVNNDANPDLIFDVPSLPAGTVANVFAVSEDADTIYLLAQLNDGTTAQIDPR